MAGLISWCWDATTRKRGTKDPSRAFGLKPLRKDEKDNYIDLPRRCCPRCLGPANEVWIFDDHDNDIDAIYEHGGVRWPGDFHMVFGCVECMLVWLEFRKIHDQGFTSYAEVWGVVDVPEDAIERVGGQADGSWV